MSDTQLDTSVADKVIARYGGEQVPTLTTDERTALQAMVGVAKIMQAYSGSLEPVLKFARDRYPEVTGDETKEELQLKALRAGANTVGTKSELAARLLALSE
tara:strand:- start:438 stop:743 length:306 start_codon:yes stop_codon:yes gene_type:complete